MKFEIRGGYCGSDDEGFFYYSTKEKPKTQPKKTIVTCITDGDYGNKEFSAAHVKRIEDELAPYPEGTPYAVGSIRYPEEKRAFHRLRIW